MLSVIVPEFCTGFEVVNIDANGKALDTLEFECSRVYPMFDGARLHSCSEGWAG